jgi:hypothetical protein
LGERARVLGCDQNPSSTLNQVTGLFLYVVGWAEAVLEYLGQAGVAVA